MMGAISQQLPFFFVQIADPQLGMIAYNENFDQETVLFEKAIQAVNKLSPSFLVCTGDLINVPKHAEQTAEAHRILNQLDKNIPLYLVPGNHDIDDWPTRETLDWYRSEFGKDWYFFNCGGYHFVAINSNIIHQGKNVPDETPRQRQWLEDDLQQADIDFPGHTIILMHHSLFLEKPDEDDDYFNIPNGPRQDYLELFEKHQIKTVLAGHLHKNSYGKAGQLEMITTAPVGLPLGSDPSGLRIFTIYPERYPNDHIEHQYYGLDDVPTRVL